MKKTNFIPYFLKSILSRFITLIIVVAIVVALIVIWSRIPIPTDGGPIFRACDC